MQTEFWRQIPDKTVIVTPNQRLASFCRYHQQICRDENSSVWETPTIVSLQQWLTLLWQQLECQSSISLPVLLNSEQTQIVWQDILRDSKWSEGLLNLPAAARMVQSAWALLQQWQVPLSDLAHYQSPEQQAFYHWSLEFHSRCQQAKWCDSTQQINFIIQAMQKQQLRLPKQIVILGFDEYPPQTQTLFKQCEQLGVHLINQDFSQPCQLQQRVVAPDPTTEIEWLARWARQQLNEGKQRVACVVPQLNTCRKQLQRVFRQYCEPASFNISSGQPLMELPMIASAVAILQCLETKIPLNVFNHLLRSPYIAAADQECASRAMLDSQLREHAEAELSLRQCCRLIADSQLIKTVPVLWQQLTKLCELQLPRQAQPSQWAMVFTNTLQLMGWPGDVALNSEEYQCLQHWQEILTTFTQLDLVKSTLTLSHGLQRLKQILQQHLFQVQTGETPIQVLGVLEAAGSPFDAMWIMGLNDQTWPAPADPNPYLPIQLQRQLDMPHASAKRELQFSQRMLQRFQHSANSLMFSHAEQAGDQHFLASPLIHSIPLITAESLPLTPRIDLASDLHTYKTFQYIDDSVGLAVSDPSQLRGGSFILKQQAACAFSAYANLRLYAEPLQQLHTGLDPLERGLLLHHVLELFWRQTQDHVTLIAYTEEQRQQLVTHCIETALKPLISSRPQLFKSRFKALEKQRLKTLVMQWLDREAERPAFKVQALEQWATFNVAGIPMYLRLDRIDQLQNGEVIVIDYKTSKTQIDDWFSDRPNEPQLPLYTLSNSEITGLVFAQIRIDNMGFKGLSRSETGLDNVLSFDNLEKPLEATSWEQQLQLWQRVLQDLAEQFRQGKATVDPKIPHLTCRHCPYPTFCRINYT